MLTVTVGAIICPDCALALTDCRDIERDHRCDRIAFDRKYYEMNDVLLLVARLLIALLFVGGAVQKGVSPQDASALLTGWSLPSWLVWPALVYNALAGVALIVGLWVRPVAMSLAAYCMLTSVFHLIPDDPWQMSIFVKNWAITGGCLALAVAGAGRFGVTPRRAG